MQDEGCGRLDPTSASGIRHSASGCVRQQPAHEHALVPQKPGLAVQPAAVADESPVSSDHAMAGDDQRNGIAPVRRRDRAHGGRHADGCGELAIGARAPRRYAAQRAPHARLERRATGLGAELCERVEVTSEVACERSNDVGARVLFESDGAETPDQVLPFPHPVVAEAERAEHAIAGCHVDRPKRRVERGRANRHVSSVTSHLS